LIVAAGDVLLQHQVGVVGVLHPLVFREELLDGVYDRHLALGAGLEAVAVDAFEHHRKDASRSVRPDIIDRSREECFGCRNPVLHGELEHLPLAGEAADQVR
jgi:hypothetical protein